MGVGERRRPHALAGRLQLYMSCQQSSDADAEIGPDPQLRSRLCSSLDPEIEGLPDLPKQLLRWALELILCLSWVQLLELEVRCQRCRERAKRDENLVLHVVHLGNRG